MTLLTLCLWRALRVGHGMADRIDALTRLNRPKGTGTAFINHSLADPEALPDPECPSGN
ncbi:hypothetical protein [Actinoplanes auranticolor]|uniref:hypothetical protein n=1 Tax=Actinoplanes auranticolor TaxID=47988 RepID=UPI001BB3B6DD|nr:hypothetical protein [Actinoplanes auranticolor]